MSCLWPDCDREALARGLCRRDYMRAKRGGRLDQFSAPERECPGCGAMFATGSTDAKSYCSVRCGRNHRQRTQRGYFDVRRAGRVCERCSGPIPQRAKASSRHCSVSCQQGAWYGSDEGRRARLCEAACRWKANHRELANEYEQRRRAVIYGCDAEKIALADVWVRDGGDCWICETPIDPDLRAPHPWSRSIDHVIPISRGGGHIMANVGLAHLRCNIAKKDRLLDRTPASVA